MRNFDRSVSSEIKTACRTTTNFGNFRDKNQNLSMGESDAQKIFMQKAELNAGKKDTLFFNSINQMNKHPVGYKLSIPLSYIQTGPNNLMSLQQTISQQQNQNYPSEGGSRAMKTTKGGNSIPVSCDNFKGKNPLSSEMMNLRLKKDQKVSCLSKSNNNATTVNNELLSSDSNSTQDFNLPPNEFFSANHQRKQIQTHFMKNRKKQQSQGQNAPGSRVNIGTLMHVMHTSGYKSGSATHSTSNTMNKDTGATQGKYGVFHHPSAACSTGHHLMSKTGSINGKMESTGGGEMASNTGANANSGSYRPGNLLMRPEAPNWSSANPKSSSPIRPSTSTAGTATSVKQGGGIPTIKNNGGKDNQEQSPGGTYNQIAHRNSVQNGLVERDNNLKQQVSNYYFQREKPAASPFSGADAKASDTINSKTCINFNLRKGKSSQNNVAPEMTSNSGFIGQVKKNKSNELEPTYNEKMSSSHAFNSTSNNIFSNGQLKIDKGDKVQIAKLLQGGQQTTSDATANACTKSGENIKDQVILQCSNVDTSSIENRGDIASTDKFQVPNVIQVQSGSYGFGVNKMTNNGSLKPALINKTMLNKRSENAVSQSPVSLRDVIGINSNENVMFGTFLDQKNRSGQADHHFNSVQTAANTHQKDGGFRLGQQSGLSNNHRAITAENMNRNRMIPITKPNKDSMKMQRNNNFVGSNLSQNDSKLAGPSNTQSNLITTSTNLASHFNKQRAGPDAGVNSSQPCANEQLKNLFAYSHTQTNMNMYHDVTMKKNSSSTSELLNTSSKSHKNTHRMIKDSGQLVNEYTAREPSANKDSVLKTNLIKKIQAEGGFINTTSIRNNLNWQGEKLKNQTEIRKLDSFKMMNKTQPNFKGNKASVKQLREKESSNIQNAQKHLKSDVKNFQSSQNDVKNTGSENQAPAAAAGSNEALQKSDKKSQNDSQIKEQDKKDSSKLNNSNVMADKKTSPRKDQIKDYESYQKSSVQRQKDGRSQQDHALPPRPGQKTNAMSPVPSSQPASTSLPPRVNPQYQKPMPTMMPDPFQIHQQPANNQNPSSPHPQNFKDGVGSDNLFMLKDKKNDYDKDQARSGPHTETVFPKKIRHGTDRSLNRTGNQDVIVGMGSGKNERIAADCNRLMQRNQINIFKNSRDSLQGLGPDKQGEGVSILQNYEFSTPNCSKIDDYTFGQLIGRGAYAEVKESLHRKTGERVAIKQYDRYKLLDVQRKKQAIREIKILSRLDHPNIIKLHESIDTAKYVYLVMEYANGESLHTHLKAQTYRQFREEKAKRIIKQLLLALEYLHDRHITHRDIKLENIIIDRQEMIKLIDFGFCCSSPPETKLKIFCGTPSYMAPEIVQRRDYQGPPTDIWATGILFYAMLCGRFPFKGKDTKDLYKQIARGQYTFPDQSDLPEEFRVSTEARLFAQKMLVVNPSARYSASKLVNDPYLRGVFTKKDRSLTSDGFLSTNESSNIISQTLAAGGNIGHINNSGSVGKSKIRAWQQYENKVMINISGSSGEKMNIAPSMHTTLNNFQRPITQSKNLNQLYGQRETLHQFKRTIFSNKTGHHQPSSNQEESKQSILSQRKAALLNANRGNIQTAGSMTQGTSGTNDRGRIPIEIKKPNISDIKRKD